MRYFTLILIFLLPIFLQAQSEEFLNGVDDLLEHFVTDGYAVLDHGGNFTNQESVIFPNYSVFEAGEKYSLIVLVEDCYSCPLVSRFVYEDGSIANIKMKISRNSGLTFAQYHFIEPKTIKGEFEVQVDTRSKYYTYMILIKK
ncbi:MAG: hypothetical protein PHF99_09495 [Bacteroidales bacterium]|nr:hypothetical protein [Bacteroidales bacterium]MDD4236233.1 hypothetical protein [Bacteroidales bacterium]